MRQQRELDLREMESWVKSTGGVKVATDLIIAALECSESKAEKLAGGRYPSLPTPAEQIALAELMQRSRNVVFPLVGAKGRSRAS